MTDPDTLAANRRNGSYLRYCASGFFIIAIGALAAVIAYLMLGLSPTNKTEGAPVGYLFVVALISSGVGFVLARMGRNSESQPESDAIPTSVLNVLTEALKKSADPFGDWTRLAGLAGGTGVFRKLELSGMPLATILMTILFCLIGLGVPFFDKLFSSPINVETSKTLSSAFIDMAKLTLGAFIGSFVTKGTSQAADATRALATTVKNVTDSSKLNPNANQLPGTQPTPGQPNAPVTKT